MERDTRNPKSRRPIAVEDDETGDVISYSISTLVTPGGLALLESEKPEALVDSLEAQIQPVTVSSVAAVIQMVDVALESYLQTPASEPKLTKTEEVREAIKGLKVGKAPGPNGIPNRDVEHLPLRAVLLLVKSSMLSYAPITFLQFGSTLW